MLLIRDRRFDLAVNKYIFDIYQLVIDFLKQMHYKTYTFTSRAIKIYITGKSTHIPNIIALLQSQGHEVVSTREPGGTLLGERLREMLLHESMHPETETLLMFAARREHIANVIAPALARGAYVLSDRFTDATYAYQCGAKGVAGEKIKILEHWVQEYLQPDVTLLFDVPVEVSIQRLATARSPDKFERESADFFTRIRHAYLQRAAENPARFRVIDANKSLNEVKVIVEDVISTL